MNKKPLASLILAGGIVLSAHTLAFAASGQDIVSTGEQFIGKPYVYGALIGDTNEFDCSSFTATVFKENGITLPRTALMQSQVGTVVQKDSLQAGDLVFFDTEFSGVIDHVGIYIGDGQMINAILSGVEVVNMNSSYWSARYVTARRVLTAASNSSQPSNPTSKTSSSDSSLSSGSGSSSSSSSSSSNSSTHKVTAGESLWTISQTYGLSVPDLETLNNLKSDTIYIGQVLTVKNVQSSGTTVNSTGTQTKAPASSKQPVTIPLYATTPKTYTVTTGDSLWSIANRYKVTVSQLETLNKLKSERIIPGQKLIISASSQTVTNLVENLSTKVSQTTPQTNTSSKSYVVKSGDTLSEIASKEGISVSKLTALNNLKSSLIFPGQKLILAQPSTTNAMKVASVNTSAESTVKIASVSTAPAKSYTVKKGDTLWDLALLNDTNTKTLMKVNKLTSPYIFPGQKLIIM